MNFLFYLWSYLQLCRFTACCSSSSQRASSARSYPSSMISSRQWREMPARWRNTWTATSPSCLTTSIARVNTVTACTLLGLTCSSFLCPPLICFCLYHVWFLCTVCAESVQVCNWENAISSSTLGQCATVPGKAGAKLGALPIHWGAAGEEGEQLIQRSSNQIVLITCFWIPLA